MSTHNICFYGEITKIILKYLPYLFHCQTVHLHQLRGHDSDLDLCPGRGDASHHGAVLLVFTLLDLAKRVLRWPP